jgi:hypothetical protein
MDRNEIYNSTLYYVNLLLQQKPLVGGAAVFLLQLSALALYHIVIYSLVLGFIYGKQVIAISAQGHEGSSCFSFWAKVEMAFKPAPNNKVDPKYKFTEAPTEASVLGSYFAQAVAIVATTNRNDLRVLTSPKQHIPPLRKMFWEEPKYNPPIENTHITAGVESHIKEEQAHWKLRGKPFPPELPQPSREKDKGPKKPEQFPHIMEKPIKQFGRKRVLHPELKVTKNFHRCGEVCHSRIIICFHWTNLKLFYSESI